MARKIVIVVQERSKNKLWRKWKRAGIGVLLSSGVIAIHSFLPMGIFGLALTLIGALTFIALYDAIYGLLQGTEDIIFSRESNGNGPRESETPLGIGTDS